MSDSPKKPVIPPTVIDLLVNDLFKKNGINLENEKNRLSSEEKQMIKELVSDLQKQVDAFVKKNPPSSPSNE